MTAFRTLVTTEAELRTLIGGDPSTLALAKEQRALDVHCRDFIARLDGMRNLLQNPHVGLIFLIPAAEETLRVNGRGAFVHCAKAFKRSGLWEPQRWPALDGLASPARILFDHTRPPGTTVEELDRVLQDGYRQRLY